jgi:hypothetical protein
LPDFALKCDQIWSFLAKTILSGLPVKKRNRQFFTKMVKTIERQFFHKKCLKWWNGNLSGPNPTTFEFTATTPAL